MTIKPIIYTCLPFPILIRPIIWTVHLKMYFIFITLTFYLLFPFGARPLKYLTQLFYGAKMKVAISISKRTLLMKELLFIEVKNIFLSLKLIN